jgi:hypothetical protein
MVQELEKSSCVSAATVIGSSTVRLLFRHLMESTPSTEGQPCKAGLPLWVRNLGVGLGHCGEGFAMRRLRVIAEKKKRWFNSNRVLVHLNRVKSSSNGVNLAAFSTTRWAASSTIIRST